MTLIIMPLYIRVLAQGIQELHMDTVLAEDRLVTCRPIEIAQNKYTLVFNDLHRNLFHFSIIIFFYCFFFLQ